MIDKYRKIIVRDISWLSFNARVLQEASDPLVPLHERIRFLGIFSNNLDEFFRVRVASLRRMSAYGKTSNMHLESNPDAILQEIQHIVILQQQKFSRIWKGISREMRANRIYLRTEKQLNKQQQKFVTDFFNEELRSNIIPLMIESIHKFPYLRDKSVYLGVVLSRQDRTMPQNYALIEIPTMVLPRFIILPSNDRSKNIILLEDIIRFSLPTLFSFFGADTFSSHIIKLTRDAELDIDNDLDIENTIIQQIEKGLKDRKKAKPVRLVYDKEIDPHLLEYLINRLNLAKRDNLIPGDRIHNFKDFMDFPESVFLKRMKHNRKESFVHPLLKNVPSIMEVINKRDILLNFPYHSFDAVIDLLREAAIDPHVTSIKLTAYRLAQNSKIVNALINAVRNGKQVSAVIELRARFDEQANLYWKELLEEAGVKVFIGMPDMKVHAKVGLIKKRIQKKTFQYGFVSTGNLNEKTARYYGDHLLLTSRRDFIADIDRIFSYLENPRHGEKYLQACNTFFVSPSNMRKQFIKLIDEEIKNAQDGKSAGMIIKVNSLSDQKLIFKLYEAAENGVEVKMIVRGICCALTENKKWKDNIQAISIIDEYLEHARVFVFYNNGKAKVFISSADWMVRNLDHRVEAAMPVPDKNIQQELIDILHLQLSGNVKARTLDNKQSNHYKKSSGKKVRSQLAIYDYLLNKKYTKK